MSETRPIGLIGLGLVGKALAARLLSAGYRVLGFDLQPTAREQAGQLGVALAGSAGEVAAAVDTLFLSLPNSTVVGQVLAAEVSQNLRPGAWLLDTTTGRPADAVEHARQLAERQVRFVDVTLSGSSEEIARGEALAMVGAPEDARLTTLLAPLAGQAFYLGQPGAGCLAKLVTNHIMGLNRAALAEGLALGEKSGLDPTQLLPLLQQGAAYSKVMDLKGRRMIEHDYDPASRVSQHAKDVRLILELGREVGAYLPLEKTHQALLAEAVAEGRGEQDNAVIIEVFRTRSDPE
jgi:3-hydroxyisobutyrate dehydrogenase-like beta-hydroxyacid dehydrogenase